MIAELRTGIAKLIQQAHREAAEGAMLDDVALEVADAVIALPEMEEMYQAWMREESYSSIYDSGTAGN